MRDSQTLAFDIYLGKKQKKNGGYRTPFITIWHKDPYDDSCGWFIRPRHANQDILAQIKSEFDFNIEKNYWFDKDGNQIFSTIGTLVLMYRCALWEHYNRNRKKVDNFMKKHLIDIINFAENPVDCGGDSITGKYYKSSNTSLLSEDRFSGLAGMVYSDILRKERKWYQHPKWHVHHWIIRFPYFDMLKRKWFSKPIDDNLRNPI